MLFRVTVENYGKDPTIVWCLRCLKDYTVSGRSFVSSSISSLFFLFFFFPPRLFVFFSFFFSFFFPLKKVFRVSYLMYPKLLFFLLLFFFFSSQVVSGDSLGHVQLWDGRHGTLLKSFSQHTADVTTLAIDGQERCGVSFFFLLF